ncbi:hypothetical protein THICB2_340008 [Thiomonas sp. CB2]|nr:hypothetical protein THICB2_340008 [Thiomonas sp. CB2]
MRIDNFVNSFNVGLQRTLYVYQTARFLCNLISLVVNFPPGCLEFLQLPNFGL